MGQLYIYEKYKTNEEWGKEQRTTESSSGIEYFDPEEGFESGKSYYREEPIWSNGKYKTVGQSYRSNGGWNVRKNDTEKINDTYTITQIEWTGQVIQKFRVTVDTEVYTRKKIKTKGEFIEEVTAEDGTFPDDGISGSYWYIKKGLANKKPTITDNTNFPEMVYNNSKIMIQGKSEDPDSEDIVTVKYKFNDFETQTISSSKTPLEYSLEVKFMNGFFYNKESKVSNEIQEQDQNKLVIWSEDDKQDKSEEVLYNFKTVNNREAVLEINKIEDQNNLLEDHLFKITGIASDPDGDNINISYAVNSDDYIEDASVEDEIFTINIPVNKLVNGENIIKVKVNDGTVDTVKSIKVNREEKTAPSKVGIIEYELEFPKNENNKLFLWIHKEIGDLKVKSYVKVNNLEYTEIKSRTTNKISDTIDELEYVYTYPEKADKVFLRIDMRRESTDTNKGITKIEGAFN